MSASSDVRSDVVMLSESTAARHSNGPYPILSLPVSFPLLISATQAFMSKGGFEC
jgi:hypothetical protein